MFRIPAGYTVFAIILTRGIAADIICGQFVAARVSTEDSILFLNVLAIFVNLSSAVR
jgi:hypothetical protein